MPDFLIVGSSRPLLVALARLLSARSYLVETAGNPAEAQTLLARSQPAVLIWDRPREPCSALDPRFLGFDGDVLVLTEALSGPVDFPEEWLILRKPFSAQAFVDQAVSLLVGVRCPHAGRTTPQDL